MIDLGIMLTRRCNFKCDHCMFSCSPYTKGDMDMKVIRKCSHLVDDPEVYGVHVYGGEPFLNMDLFEEMFEWVYRPEKAFSVSTNGSFLLSRKKRERVWKILRRIHNSVYRGCHIIQISNDQFHEEFWSEELKKYLQSIRHYRAMDLFPEFEETSDFNDVYCMIEDNKLYVQSRIKDIIFNPSGRALKNGFYKIDWECFCSLFCDEDDEDILLNVRPNGDVDCCCYCDSAILGNVMEEPHFDIPLFQERLNFLKSYMMSKYYKGDKLPPMKDVCPICKTLRVKNDGVYMKNKKVLDKED